MSKKLILLSEPEIRSREDLSAAEKQALAASLVPFPKVKQRDLLYVASVLVSTGTNKNGAHFLGSELVKAHESVAHKPMDLEHVEEDIVGHIYDKAYVFKNSRRRFDPIKALRKRKSSQLDALECDIVIGSVVYASRFPDVARAIREGEYKVSMETWYEDFDIKIGDIIISRAEAEALGYVDLVGEIVQVKKNGKPLGKRLVARVLRTLTFCGCGFVKNPANEDSVVVEVAKLMEDKDLELTSDTVVELENIESIVREEYEERKLGEVNTDRDIMEDGFDEKIQASVNEESRGLEKERGTQVYQPADDPHRHDTLRGLCAWYRNEEVNEPVKTQDSEVTKRDWCNLYSRECPVNGDGEDPKCLRIVVKETIDEKVEYIRRDSKDAVYYQQQSVEELTGLIGNARRVMAEVR